MTRKIPMDTPLSEEDRAYLLMRGEDGKVTYLDQEFPADVEDVEVIEDVEGDDYDQWTPAELQAEAAKRGLTVSGTGAKGNVLKSDLIRALRDFDSAA